MALEVPAQPPDTGAIDAARLTAPGLDAPSHRPKTIRVVSARVSVWRRLADIWDHRELLIYLVRTEIKVKYKNSFLGLLWSLLSPALNLLVYTVVFGIFLKNGIPNFVLYLFAGLLLWNFFSVGVLTATSVVVNNAGLVKKVSFPREILALAAIGSSAVFLFFQACVMVIFLIALHNAPAWSLLWLLVWALIPTAVFASAPGGAFAAVNVYLRDTQHLVTVIVGSAWFWAGPIVYSYTEQVSSFLQKHHLTALYFLNPLTPLVMTYERVLYNHMGLVTLTSLLPTGHKHGQAYLLPSWPYTTYVWGDAIVLGVALVLFFVAMLVFGRLAGNFAEEL